MLALLLAACGGGSSSGLTAPPNPPGSVSINLYPSANDGRRIWLMVTQVGSLPVGAPSGMPVGFDTGSAGLTLYAPDIFPASMVSSSGFVFASGQDTLSYNGITVTQLQGERKYGGADGRTEMGNLGFATVTFGDGDGTLTTASMPVLFYFSITDNSTGAPVPVPVQHGWFGVNDAPNAIVVSGSVAPAGGFPLCDAGTTTTCWVASVLKYVTYNSGVHGGFLLAPSPLQDCSIVTPGSCSPAAILSVGITDAMKSSYQSESLVCPPAANPYSGPAMIEGYAVCQSLVGNVSVGVTGSTSASSSGTLNGYALFDTGTPYMAFDVPQGTVFPTSIEPNSQIQVTLSSGFVYGYTSGTVVTANSVGPFSTLVNGGTANSLAETIVGVDYFTQHGFFIDYTASQEGWK